MTDPSDELADRPSRPGGFCRDCLTEQTHKVSRCQKCGSPRVLWHGEMFDLSMAHVDCDAFYATVEKRDHPSLRDHPVIIGGGRRGVVMTACYLARIKGVRSAMPMWQALKACPEAKIVRPNMDKYAEVGRQVRELMFGLTPLVEPLSIDEAFLDLAGTEKVHGAPPAITLASFSQRVAAEIGITISVGLSHNKFLAKIASDFRKPRGFSVIGRQETVSFMASNPVSIIWGVGAATQAKLSRDGIHTVADLQALGADVLTRRYGSMGLRLAHLAFGRDQREVKSSRKSKSVSAETTFNDDKSDRDELAPILRHLSEKVSRRLKAKNIAGRTIVLKMKTSNFKSRTRNRTLPDPTQLAEVLYETTHELMMKELDARTKFRLIGVGVSDLTDGTFADPGDLTQPDLNKRISLERAMDSLVDRFGDRAVETGLTYGAIKPRERRDENADDLDAAHGADDG
ncbi:MAG: DNA polymerase IV [Pseudomonadota bacterium]